MPKITAVAWDANTYVVRGDGHVEPIGHVGRAELAPGDLFVVETPGGGGFGAS